MFAFLLPYSLGGIAGPSIQGIISTQVPPNEQGELQGGLTGLMSVGAIIGPPVMTNLFAFFTRSTAPFYFPGAPFLTASVLTVVSVIFAMRALRSYVPAAQPQAIPVEVNPLQDETRIGWLEE